jgi:2,3-bisphosphoglycerate-dependent phosphoglycerate mutase
LIIKNSFIYQIDLKGKQMSYLILVRHGQSIWNLEKKFTGWVDVDLTENGKLEAKKSGELIKSKNINIDIYYSSFQLRAKNTLKLIKEILQDTTISKEAWQLNERHYGALTGLNKDEMKLKLGEEKVHQFRRSWDLRPDPLDKNNPYHPTNIETYKEIPINEIPDTESLKDTYARVLEFYKKDIENKISENNILISAHGNSIRALCKYLFKLDENQISKLEIPTGNPLLITLDGNKKITDCKYLDDGRAKDLVVF